MDDLLEQIGISLLWIARHYGDPASSQYLGEEVSE
jgi:hypothetical protein